MRKLNKRLKARIFEVYGTQVDYALEIGEDETLVSKVICGRRTLSLEKQKKWAAALGRKPRDLFIATRKVSERNKKKPSRAHRRFAKAPSHDEGAFCGQADGLQADSQRPAAKRAVVGCGGEADYADPAG